MTHTTSGPPVLILIINLLTIVLTFQARLFWFFTYNNITFRHKHKNLERAYRGFWVVLIYRGRKITFGVCLPRLLSLCWFMVYRTRNVWLCACVGLWFIERGILHLECAFLGCCACAGLWFIERGMCGFALVLVYGL